jgi:hypothetical protein
MGLGTDIIVGFFMVVLLSILITEVYATQEQIAIPPLHERRIVDMQFYDNQTLIIHLDDGTIAKGTHTFTPDRGFVFENNTIYLNGTDLFGAAALDHVYETTEFG